MRALARVGKRRGIVEFISDGLLCALLCRLLRLQPFRGLNNKRACGRVHVCGVGFLLKRLYVCVGDDSVYSSSIAPSLVAVFPCVYN